MLQYSLLQSQLAFLDFAVIPFSAEKRPEGEYSDLLFSIRLRILKYERTYKPDRTPARTRPENNGASLTWRTRQRKSTNLKKKA
jgi:hypothetical protein